MRVLIISNTFDSLIRLRGELIKQLVARSVDVLCLAPKDNSVSGEGPESVIALGARIATIPMSAAAISPLADLRTLLSVFRIVRLNRPDAILTYTIKPNTIGVVAARLASPDCSHIVAIMNGLGFSFLNSIGCRGTLLRLIVSSLYAISFRLVARVFFYNQQDLDMFLGRGLVNSRSARLIPGSGVNTDFYRASPVPVETVIFLLIGRLIREKGIYEYVQAARVMKRNHPQVRFALLGPYYQSPSAIEIKQVLEWQEEGVIEYWGHAADVRPFLKQCSVLVLPSYREGLSRVLLEGLAMGRPLLVSDVPGCRELVTEGENGCLAKAGDVEDLVAAMERMLSQKQSFQHFGDFSRDLAIRRYDSKITCQLIIEALRIPQ